MDTANTQKTGKGKGISEVLHHPILKTIFEIDLRSLALFRIGLGLTLIIDLAGRLPNLAAHYSDAGVLPRSEIETGINLHAAFGHWVWPGFLMLIAAVFACMLIVGYKTWLATAASWILVISLQERNHIVTNSGDQLLALMLFWSLFLPLGGRGSIDQKFDKNFKSYPVSAYSIASAALLLQAVYMYFFSAIFKNHPMWHTEGTAVYYALQMDTFTTPLGKRLLDFPAILPALSYGAYYLELIGGFFAFIPFRFAFFRTLTAGVFILFHLSLALTMNLMIFPFFCMVAWLPFLPKEFWDRIKQVKIVQNVSSKWESIIQKSGKTVRRATTKAKWLSPTPPQFSSSQYMNWVVGFFFVYAFVHNATSLTERGRPPFPLSTIGSVLRLQQEWRMFSPHPPSDDGWWVIPATLRDGSIVNLYNGEEFVSWETPENIASTYGVRWKKYFHNIWSYDKFRPKLAYYADWLRRHWDEDHEPEQHVKSLEIYYRLQWTREDFKPPLYSKQKVFWWNENGDSGYSNREDNIANFEDELRALGYTIEWDEPY